MEKKIAIYSGIVPSTTFIENLIRAIADEGCTVYIFGYSKNKTIYSNSRILDFTHPRKNWKRVIFVTWNKLRLRFQSYEKYRKLKKHIHSKKVKRKIRWIYWLRYLPVVMNLPDIFHIQWAKNLDEWMFLKELFGVKIVVSLRGTHIKYSPLANPELAASYRRNFPRVDGFHAVSKDIAITASQFGAPPEKIRVVYSGIDIGEINKYHTAKPAGTSTSLNIISVGRMKWIKGYHLVLDALRKLADSGIKFHYTLIARGDAEEILYQAADLKLTDYITIIPGIPQQEVFRKIAESDLLLLSSFDEGIANVALEAMALGIPVLSSDCGGMEEVVNNNQTGYIYRNRDVNDLFEKLTSFASKHHLNDGAVTRLAKNYVLQHHTVEQLGRNMKLLYQDITDPVVAS